jgi:hypothetical protein
VADEPSDDDYERTAFRVVSIDTLPDSEVDLAGWHGPHVDWYSVSQVAVEIFEAGVDPLDHDEVKRRVTESELRPGDRSWAEGLFCEPVGIYRRSRRWVDGRHRTNAMRGAGVKRCLVQVLE